MKEKQRIFDLINIKEWEVKCAVVVSCVFVVIFVYIDIYEKYSLYIDAIENLTTNILNAFIGLLGFSLSGIAIIVSMFSKKEVELIEKDSGRGAINNILSSYVFLAKNIGIQCLVLIVIYFITYSERVLFPVTCFYLLVWLECYHVTFIIFYTIALVKNCVKLYQIKNIYGKISETKKTMYDEINEVKNDYIFSTLSNICRCTNEEVVKDLIRFIEEGEIKNKNEILKYIKNQYNIKE